jgi:hypothetical protein
MKRISRFTKGSGKYKCECCGKETRETGDGESSVNLCAKCYYEAGIENEHLDGEHKIKPHPDCPLCKKEM